ncbi:metallophosphoesterase [Prolixibacteraceae bacterium Z1-6]|uniref:Metallophosphoesterase n=1 Tax=Draconibacterium aestuarii TaxID=2998507 RepID=A0A9X3F421_9BACT|nr:metallophosphoesterase [Prolixibacteraceae bacterium Z1-6]
MKGVYYLFILLVIALSGCTEKKSYDKISFGICSDVHLPTMHDSEYRIQTFIDSMNSAKPDFIIELGDFGIPKEQCAPYFDIWNSFDGDKYHVIGNHEMDGGTSRQAAVDYRHMTKSYYSFNKNGFHMIVLDGNDKKSQEAKGYKQYIGPEQVEWLKQDLEEITHPVIIFSHQGLQMYKGANENYGVENYKQIQQILENHSAANPANKVIACFNGHSHWDYAEEINGIHYVTITSMAYHWLGDDYQHIRYSEAVDENYRWIKYTAPFKEPLFGVVEVSTQGYIKIKGKKTEWVGPSPFEVGFPERMKKYLRPAISDRYLEFKLK